MRDEVRNKIKKITIHTKRLMQSAITGDYLSAFKGSGLEFHQLREYTMGDDIRFIDWNSSAKMNRMMVKEFIEERERTIILAVDISASSQFSSNQELRAETIAQVTATLAYIATQNNDKVGAIFFSDRIEAWLEPRRGNAHYGKIIETLFSLKPLGRKTNIQEVLRFLLSLKQRNAILFMLSDWIDDENKYSRYLKIASFKYDFIAIRFLDHCEEKLPSFGLFEMQDPEGNDLIMLDTRQKSLQKRLTIHHLEQKKMFEKLHIDFLPLMVGQPFVNPLIQFFHQRIQRQI